MPRPESWSTPPLPESWQTDEIRELLLRYVDFRVMLLELLAIHGNLQLALKHPKNTGESAQMMWGVIERIEHMFRYMGLPEPPGGWRATVDR